MRKYPHLNPQVLREDSSLGFPSATRHPLALGIRPMAMPGNAAFERFSGLHGNTTKRISDASKHLLIINVLCEMRSYLVENMQKLYRRGGLPHRY